MPILDRLQDALAGVGADAVVQVAATAFLFAAVLAAARLLGARLGMDPVRAVARGCVQVIAMGFLLTAILALHAGWSALVLLGMCVVAADISRRRSGAGGTYTVALAAITFATAITVTAMLAMGALRPTVRDLVPVGSIIVATCMRTASLAFERYDREAGGPDAAPQAVGASLIPAIDGMRSLGLVWIPGIMTGLVLAGVPPVRAAFLQFVVVALGFVAAALTSLSAMSLIGRAAPYANR